MPLSYSRYGEIKEVVAQTLQLGKVSQVPICPYTLASSLGIRLVTYSSLSKSKMEACFELSNEGFTLDNTIYYNDSMYEKRTRFTIMHEIGHIMLNHPEESDVTEEEANFFAKYILAPPVLIYAHDRTCDIDETKIRRIFYVSDEVSIYIFKYYQSWLSCVSRTVALHPIDSRIYDLFYRGGGKSQPLSG